INKGAARFDFQKLEALNGIHMRQMDDGALFDVFLSTLPHLEGGAEFLARLDEGKKAQLRAALPGLKERAKTLLELLDGAGFLVAERPLTPDEKAAGLLDQEGRALLRDLAAELDSVPDWNAEATEAVVRAFAE